MRKIWESIKTSLWFLPMIIVTSSVLMAFALLEIDRKLVSLKLVDEYPRIFGAGAEGARQMLSVIAGSVISVAGTAFSITIVVLALASSQYSPRVLRNFVSDWQNQTVLGGFLGIFVYCLVVLRTIRGEDHDAFVPSVAVLVSFVLAFVGVLLFIFFIHHIAHSIRATSIAKAVYKETLAAIEVVFPKGFDGEVPSTAEAGTFDPEKWLPVTSNVTGYLRSVNLSLLSQWAEKNNTVLRMEIGVGAFITESSPIAWLYNFPEEPKAWNLIRSQIMLGYHIGGDRTFEQDVAYGLRQLVDVALKGLSAGINDTTSALVCIDYIGAILSRLSERDIDPRPILLKGRLRLLTKGPNFASLVSEGLDQIRQNAERNPAVLLRLLQALKTVLHRVKDPRRVQVIEENVNLVSEVFKEFIPERDSAELQKEFISIREVARQKFKFMPL